MPPICFPQPLTSPYLFPTGAKSSTAAAIAGGPATAGAPRARLRRRSRSRDGELRICGQLLCSSKATWRWPTSTSRLNHACLSGHGHGAGGDGWPKKGHPGACTFELVQVGEEFEHCTPLHPASSSGGRWLRRSPRTSTTRTGSAAPPPPPGCPPRLPRRPSPWLARRLSTQANPNLHQAARRSSTGGNGREVASK